MARPTNASGFGFSKPQTKQLSQAELTARIQQKAKQIWEQKGRVSGKDLENWVEAEKLVKSGKA
ncbi:MAG: DUF2934 domain-containing protein [Candidatus Paceibacterota bacterium]|jgi:hypothetical protein